MKYDLHTHTHYSSCSILKPLKILKVAKKFKLNGIAITDHNTIQGGLEVSKLNKDKDFEVIVGSETNTDRGHVLGLYINKEIKSKDFFEVVDEIRKQGGIVIIAHPFRLLPQLSFKQPPDFRKYLDAVECNNGRTFYFGNRKALKFADKYNLAKTGGSDSHFSFEIGRCYTIFDGDLIKAIKYNKTKIGGVSFTGLAGGLMSFFKRRIPRM